MRFAIVVALAVLAGCAGNRAPDDDLAAVHAPEIARIVPAGEALSGAHIPTLDPATLKATEITKTLGAGPRCEFRYTSAGRPVLAWKAPANGATAGVVKLNGHLVMLEPASTTGDLVLAAEQVRLTVRSDRESTGTATEEASVTFEVGSRLKVGYRGYYNCGKPVDESARANR